jgi:thioredoxin 2
MTGGVRPFLPGARKKIRARHRPDRPRLDVKYERTQLQPVLVPCSSCSKQNRLPAARLLDKARCAACKAALLPVARPVPITSTSDFDELIRDAKAPVLVDFWANWCGPCRAVAPEVEKLAAQKQGRTIVAKVDTDAQPELSARFGIRSIPTLVVFRNGREAQRISGAMPASAMAAQLGL